MPLLAQAPRFGISTSSEFERREGSAPRHRPPTFRMVAEKIKSAKLGSSPLWNRALERYRDELSEDDAYDEILNESGSLQDVLDYAASFEGYFPQSKSSLLSFNRLGPALRFVDDLSAMIAICFGADFKATALLWGSIRLILSLAIAASDRLQHVLEMLEELSLNLPELRSYERSLNMTPQLESALLELYTEIICFYARMIHFFKTNPHVALQRQAWSDFENDFQRTSRRILRMSSRAKSEADIAKMSMDQDRYREVLDLVTDMKDTKLVEQESQAVVAKCYVVPLDPDVRFYGREDALVEIHTALDQTGKGSKLRTFAVYGMGGVGKTQVALQYASEARSIFDAVIWLAAETSYSIAQSARDAAQALKLLSTEAEQQDISGSVAKLRTWLRNADRRWLLILDNADDLDVVQQVWPSGGTGSVLITSRDFGAASSPASAGFHLRPFDGSTGSTLLLRILGKEETDQDNLHMAAEVVKLLGGLPLALNQIASFILQRKLPLGDFPKMYDRNASQIDSRKSRLTQYERTLSNVWELSLSKLSGNSALLHGLLSLLNPDVIDEALLSDGGTVVSDPDFAFLADEMDLGDAEEALLQAALIEKNEIDQHLSVHRLVQAAVMRKASASERTKYVDTAVQILTHIFSGTQLNADVVHFLKSWTHDRWILHERCIPHVMSLVRQCKKYNIRSTSEQDFLQLLMPCEISVRERELFDMSEEINSFALDYVQDKQGTTYAGVLFRDGLHKLYTHESDAAVPQFKEGIALRERLLGADHSLVAWGYNNLGMCFTELGQHEAALKHHNIALEKRQRNDVGCVGNSYSNLASLHLKMGEPKKAEEYLFSCPSLKNLTDEDFLSMNNPRVAGDMVLLSRIRRAQGQTDEALRLASKALGYRRKLLGNRFTTCDSMHDVASMLIDHQQYGAALSMLQELVAIAESLPGSNGLSHLARAYFRMSVLSAKINDPSRSEDHKLKAIGVAKRLAHTSPEAVFDEAYFSGLCPWMLW